MFAMSDLDEVNDDESVQSEGSVDHESENGDESENENEGDVEDESEDKGEGGVEDEDETKDVIKTKKPKKIHKLSLTETEDFNKKLKKRGVIYVARVPPRMTPSKIKSLLSDFTEVTRVFLVEEDASVRKRRKREYGGSGGKRYVEGWVELASKRKAKHIAASLNLTPISNTKRNPHYGKKIQKGKRNTSDTIRQKLNLLTMFNQNLLPNDTMSKGHYGISNISINSSGRI